jgi:hypothetical protein
MSGPSAPDMIVMGLGLWDIAFSPLTHSETLGNYARSLIKLKYVIIVFTEV